MLSTVLKQALAGGAGAPLDPRLLTLSERPLGVPDVMMVLLQDALGRLQVILPSDHLLDVDALNRKLGRDLRAVPRGDLDVLLKRLKVERLWPVPTLTNFETIVDNSVRTLPQVLFMLDAQGNLASVDTGDFERVAARARWVDCAIPLSRIDVNLDEPGRDREQIHQALRRFTQLRIQQRLEDTLELPPLPETARRIIHLRVDPEADVEDLAEVVESDPSLAAQVVSWASSSFYAAPGNVRSVHDAIVRVLGFDLVMNLAVGLSLGKSLKQPKDAPDGLLAYWPQSIWMAQGAGILSSLMPRNRRPAFGLAYLGGLLHNFGYLVLAHVFPPHFSLICRYTEANRHLDSIWIEQWLLGITREQIVAQLMQVWGMPEEVTAALRQQKNPEYQGVHADYANLLWMSRQLLAERGVALGLPQAIPGALYARLGLNPELVAEEFDALAESADQIASMAGMMAG